jgi:hypothetical protein
MKNNYRIIRKPLPPEVGEGLDSYNQYLDSINANFRYVLRRKKFIIPKPIKFFVVDECINDTHSIQTYLQIHNAICYLKKMRLQDINFKFSDAVIKRVLSPYVESVYDLIKIDGMCKISRLGEVKYSLIVKYLYNLGLHTEMTPLDIYKSNFFLQNKDKFQLQDSDSIFTP